MIRKQKQKFEHQTLMQHFLFFLFVCLCVCAHFFFHVDSFYSYAMLYRQYINPISEWHKTVCVLFTYSMLATGKKSNNASWERKKTHMCMPCREKRQYSFTFLFFSFFVCLKWIYVNVLLSFFRHFLCCSDNKAYKWYS